MMKRMDVGHFVSLVVVTVGASPGRSFIEVPQVAPAGSEGVGAFGGLTLVLIVEVDSVLG